MYTGGIDLRKNIEALIRSYASLPPVLRQQHQLAIVCSVQPTDRERLEKLARQSGLAKDDVILTGFVPDEDLPVLYNACELFVFPSWHEGFGLPALEAMACGAPVIAANTSSLPEVIGREDALFDPHSETAIAAKMHQALTDRSWSDDLRLHGLRQAKMFSWNASAKRAIAAFEQQFERRQHELKTVVAAKAATQRKPRLAYFSPLPPERSGIADYSAELLPELSRYYEVDLIVDQDVVGDAWLSANFVTRSWQWFDEHAADYDRVLYNIGNSSFHTHMFGLLERHPGVIVLHDFFLSGIFSHLEMTREMPDSWWRALYASHGYDALIARQQSQNANEVIWEYPCNLQVIAQAEGVIVHSSFSRQLAQQWYGSASTGNWTMIPHLRRPACGTDRQAARRQLGLGEDDFLLCSFGILGLPKLNHRLLQAWLASPLAADAHCHLVFVGQNDGGEYGKKLLSMIASSEHGSRIRITGFADLDLFRTYLAAADGAVQLRGLSRGETSGTVLDCMANGVPCIVNDNGSMKELPGHALLKLEDDFQEKDLLQKMLALRGDASLRKTIGDLAARYIRDHHTPDKVGARYFEAIEQFFDNEPGSKLRRSLRKMADIQVDKPPAESDLKAVARCLSMNSPTLAVKQLLLDISILGQAGSDGVDPGLVGLRQRASALITALARSKPGGRRLEPVMMTETGLRYARRLTCDLLNIPSSILDDDVVEARNGDVYVSLEERVELPEATTELLRSLDNAGVTHTSFALGRPAGPMDQAELTQWIADIAGHLEHPAIAA
uniref:glycosyltransferase n=1 Tax=Undibacterium sp. TaxID=1914977 RepID=UPI00374CCA17